MKLILLGRYLFFYLNNNNSTCIVYEIGFVHELGSYKVIGDEI